MEVKYNIHVVELKVTITRTQRDSVWQTLTEQDVQEINNYVQTHQLGIRIAYDMWKFKNKKSLKIGRAHV